MRGTKISEEWFRLCLNLYIRAFGWLSDESFGQKLDFGSLKSPPNLVLTMILMILERRSDDCTISECRKRNVMMGVCKSLL